MYYLIDFARKTFNFARCWHKLKKTYIIVNIKIMKGEKFMEKGKKLMLSICSIIPTLAIVVTSLNVNTACYWVAHQDKLPQTAKKLRKF